MKDFEGLLEAPYWIIDVLPGRVPPGGPGQYFVVEDYLITHRRDELAQRQLDFLLKLNCYFDIYLEGVRNPAPARLAELVGHSSVQVLIGEALLTSDPDDTYMTLFAADERLRNLASAIAISEGLFMWRGDA